MRNKLCRPHSTIRFSGCDDEVLHLEDAWQIEKKSKNFFLPSSFHFENSWIEIIAINFDDASFLKAKKHHPFSSTQMIVVDTRHVFRRSDQL